MWSAFVYNYVQFTATVVMLH